MDSNGSSIKLPTVPRERIIHAVLPKGSVGTGHCPPIDSTENGFVMVCLKIYCHFPYFLMAIVWNTWNWIANFQTDPNKKFDQQDNCKWKLPHNGQTEVWSIANVRICTAYACTYVRFHHAWSCVHVPCLFNFHDNWRSMTQVMKVSSPHKQAEVSMSACLDCLDLSEGVKWITPNINLCLHFSTLADPCLSPCTCGSYELWVLCPGYFNAGYRPVWPKIRSTWRVRCAIFSLESARCVILCHDTSWSIWIHLDLSDPLYILYLFIYIYTLHNICI